MKGINLGIEDWDFLSQLDNIFTITLEDNLLHRKTQGIWSPYMPSYLSRFSSLSSLSMMCNGLKVLPPHIYSLTTLANLDLCDNEIESFPDKLGMLVNLERLTLSKNKLADLSESYLSSLTKLQYLWLDDNAFEKVMIFDARTRLWIY